MKIEQLQIKLTQMHLEESFWLIYDNGFDEWETIK